MLFEGIILNKNNDIIEIGLFPEKIERYVFVPEKFADHFSLGQRLIVRLTPNLADLEILIG